MTQDFCEHLEEYAIAFGRAKASYGNCLNLLDKIIDDPTVLELCTTLENALDEWVLETRQLRELFRKMAKKGEIELVTNPDPEEKADLKSAFPICRDCSSQVPRLEFSEFDLTDENNPTFRLQALPRPALNS